MKRENANGNKPSVFLSFAVEDKRLAAKVEVALTSMGVKVVRMDDAGSGGEYNDTVRRALTRSAAVVAVLSRVSKRSEIPASVLFEIGAAVGTRKPIFVVVDDPKAKLPFNVPHLQVLPMSRLDEIAHHVLADAAA